MAHRAGPAQRRRGLTFGGAKQGVPWINGKPGKESQSSPEAAQQTGTRQQAVQAVLEIMGLREGDAQLLQQRFQILLGRLLTMEADLIRTRLWSRAEYFGRAKVVLRFAYPLAGHPFHRGFSLCS